MPIDYSGSARLKKFGPKIGETDLIHIREINRIEDSTGQSDDNFRSRTKNWGFHYECVLTNDRSFLLNNWKLYYAFKGQDVQDGDLVQINHVGEGEYEVEVLERGTGVGVVVPDEEKEAYLAQKRADQGNTKEAAPAPVAKKATAVKAKATTTKVQEEDGEELPF